MMTADAVWYKLVQVTACPVILCIQMSFPYQICLNLVVNSSHIVKKVGLKKSNLHGLLVSYEYLYK